MVFLFEMNIFVVQVYTGDENKFLRFAEKTDFSDQISFYFPKRELMVRKNRKLVRTTVPVFPGYVFAEAESISSELFAEIRLLPHFGKFLKDNLNITPLPEDEKRIIFQLTKYGRIIKKSFVVFDENDKIQVQDGPLKGLEGLIVKVDRRKKRAKVRLRLYENSFLVDFGFDFLDRL